MTSPDGSLITAELERLAGVDGPPHEATVTPELVRRVLETMEDADPRWTDRTGATAPPYVLMAFGADLPLPETPRAPLGLVTGDDWTLTRMVRVGERLRVVGRLASVHERFGSRFGHNLVLRTTWTYTDETGGIVAEAGRSAIRYAPPDEPTASFGRRPVEAGFSVPPPNGVMQDAPQRPGELTEGDALSPAVVRPSLAQIVRYCGLTWNFVPFFFDPEEARRGGLPGPIVPGPLKLACLTRWLGTQTGPGGAVRAVRCAHRRPDQVGQPLTLRGVVTHAGDDGGHRLIDCEIWTENVRGERSVTGSATLVTVGRG
jgi:acyl dehydratase